MVSILEKAIKADGTKDTKVNPDVYEIFTRRTNPYMTGQMLQEKLAVQLKLNNNAFAYISEMKITVMQWKYIRNTATSCEAVKDKSRRIVHYLFIKKGNQVTLDTQTLSI